MNLPQEAVAQGEARLFGVGVETEIKRSRASDLVDARLHESVELILEREPNLAGVAPLALGRVAAVF